ncbi:MAG: hypothetical protein IJX39_08870 [Clostridia bacterium]|nr:hypothetical protein [Clostridia bacterium]
MRKAKRAAMTERAIQLNLQKLDSTARDSGMSVPDYLREVICRGWQAFYVIRDYAKPERTGGNIFLDLAKEDAQ